jgi:uncharacterized protein YjiK
MSSYQTVPSQMYRAVVMRLVSEVERMRKALAESEEGERLVRVRMREQSLQIVDLLQQNHALRNKVQEG